MKYAKEQIRLWLTHYMANTASAEEEALLMDALFMPEMEDWWNELIMDAVQEEPVITRPQDWDDVRQALLREMRTDSGHASSVHRVHFLRRGWIKYAAAIIIMFGIGAYFWIANRQEKPALAQVDKPLDIAPGGNKAMLTLSDGTTIVLDSAANGNLAQQGNAQIIKLDSGRIAYDMKGSAEGEAMINTMSTPNGGQYQLTLPDGTKVWLNAASSITYPVAFTGTTRNVKVTGEVYFEVAKNKEKPFIVELPTLSEGGPGGMVEVLGTHFNINSYENEGAIRTTLLEGKVKIQSAIRNSQSAILKPGEQAIYSRFTVDDSRFTVDDSRFTIDHSPDIDKVMAWKNGIFNFTGMNLKAVMRQLERWYDIKVVYKGTIADDLTFQGKMYRSVTLSSIMTMFEDSGIKLQLEGKTLTVL